MKGDAQVGRERGTFGKIRQTLYLSPLLWKRAGSIAPQEEVLLNLHESAYNRRWASQTALLRRWSILSTGMQEIRGPRDPELTKVLPNITNQVAKHIYPRTNIEMSDNSSPSDRGMRVSCESVRWRFLCFYQVIMIPDHPSHQACS